MRSTHQDRWEKAEAAAKVASEECARTYAIWKDACERLRRIEVERAEAWSELMDTIRNPPARA